MFTTDILEKSSAALDGVCIWGEGGKSSSPKGTASYESNIRSLGIFAQLEKALVQLIAKKMTGSLLFKVKSCVFFLKSGLTVYTGFFLYFRHPNKHGSGIFYLT